MTKKARCVTAAVVVWLVSLAIMNLLQAHGPQPFFIPHAVSHGVHPMAAMWDALGWMMVLGPIAMLLFFGSILTLLFLFFRALSEKAQGA